MQNKSTIWLDELRKERLQGSSRNPGFAALMSFFVMGLGQIYAGHVDRGIMLLAIHLTSIFSALSIYSRGLLYETLSPVMSTQALVLSCYVFCVGYILLWIYNIKDAYYLSLFSSFRDWFEVERVLLPMLKVQSDNLLAGFQVSKDLLVAPEMVQSNHVTPPQSQPDLDEADFIEVKASSASEGSEEKVAAQTVTQSSSASDNDAEKEVFYADVDAVSFGGQSWKLYVGLALIFILVGLWFRKEPEKLVLPAENETLFAMAADLPDPEVIEQIKDAPDSEEAQIVKQQVVSSIETTFIASASLAEIAASQQVKAPLQSFVAGLTLVGKGDYASACAEFEKDLLVASPDKDTWTIILNAFYRSDNKLAYELKLRKYLEEFSSDSSAWFNLGKILYDREAVAEAAQALVQGLKYEPDNVRGNFLLGSIYTDLKLFDDASVYLKKAVEFEPLNLEFVFELAQSLHFAGKPAEAVKFYQRVLSLDASHTQAIKAIKEINSSFNAPETSQNFDLTGVPEEEQVLIIQGKNQSRVMAKSESGRVLYQSSISPTFPSHEISGETEPQGTVLFEAEPVALEDEIVVKTETIPVTANAKISLPEKALEPEEQRESVKIAEPAKPAQTEPTTSDLKSDPPITMELSKNAGISLLEAGLSPKTSKSAAASENFDDSMMDAVALENSGANEALEAIRKSAFSEYSRGNWERSLPLYLEYLKKKPDPRAYDVVSIIFEKLHMPNDAFDACEHAYKAGLHELPTLIRLGRLAEETSRFAEGERYLSLALQKSPHRVDLRIRYARCLAMNGQPAKAIAELESVANANSDSYSVKTRVANEIREIRKKVN